MAYAEVVVETDAWRRSTQSPDLRLVMRTTAGGSSPAVREQDGCEHVSEMPDRASLRLGPWLWPPPVMISSVLVHSSSICWLTRE